MVKHLDPFFVGVSVLNLLKVVHSSNDIIFAVKVVTTALLLHLGEEVVAWGCPVHISGWLNKGLTELNCTCIQRELYNSSPSTWGHIIINKPSYSINYRTLYMWLFYVFPSSGHLCCSIFPTSVFSFLSILISRFLSFLPTFVFVIQPFCMSFCSPFPDKLMRRAHLRDQSCVGAHLSHYHLIITPLSSLFIWLSVPPHFILSLRLNIR